MTTVGVKDYRLLIDGTLTESASGEHSVILKPASLTPLTTLGLVWISRQHAFKRKSLGQSWSRCPLIEKGKR